MLNHNILVSGPPMVHTVRKTTIGFGISCYPKCSRHGFMYIRGWMQMVLHQMIYFPKKIIQCNTILAMDMLHYCRLMHNDTYSLHDRSLKPWWSHLPRSQTFYYVYSPPLSRLNWCSLSPIGGPGPPTPKVASPLLGSVHTPFPGSRTLKLSAETCSL